MHRPHLCINLSRLIFSALDLDCYANVVFLIFFQGSVFLFLFSHFYKPRIFQSKERLVIDIDPHNTFFKKDNTANNHQNGAQEEGKQAARGGLGG